VVVVPSSATATVKAYMLINKTPTQNNKDAPTIFFANYIKQQRPKLPKQPTLKCSLPRVASEALSSLALYALRSSFVCIYTFGSGSPVASGQWEWEWKWEWRSVGRAKL
jgi:hypothetical protein